MKKTIKIANKEYNLESTALTSLAYKKLFGEDILATLGSFKTDNITGAQASDAIESVSKLAFVMNKQADGLPVKDLMHLKEDDFYEWLNQFEYGALYDADTIADILGVWSGNLTTSVKAKN